MGSEDGDGIGCVKWAHGLVHGRVPFRERS